MGKRDNEKYSERELAQTAKQLRDTIPERLAEVPDSLKPENVGPILDRAEKEKKEPKVIHFPVRRFAAVAAAFVVLLAAVFVVPALVTGNTLFIGKDNAETETILRSSDRAADYSAVQAVFERVAENAGSGNRDDGNKNEIAVESMTAVEETAPEFTGETADGLGSGGDDYSETNVQVEGVDEADILKTDGKYLYFVTNTDNWRGSTASVHIVRADAGDMTELWSYTPADDYTVSELYLTDGRLTLILTAESGYYDYYYKSYDDGSGRVNTTRIEIYDVTDPAAPVLTRSFEQEGTYSDSRLADGKLLLISDKYLYSYILPTNEDGSYIFDPENVIPKVCDSVVSDALTILPADRCIVFPETEDSCFTVVSTLEIASAEPAQSLTVMGGTGTVYATDSTAYLSAARYEYKTEEYGEGEASWVSCTTTGVYTDIVRLSYADTLAQTGTATVPGTLCSQFAMDEYLGNLRVATNESYYDGERNVMVRRNNFYVLDADLKRLGTLEGLADGEEMYSVRFEGDTVYAVTYRQIDPFFVINLSDPAHPYVAGELKIPGFSQYLHVYDENRVLGFGLDAAESEDSEFGLQQGFKLAMFDVSDPSNPKELDTLYIGDRGSSSELLYDHKALLFDREKNIIGFPIYITKSNSGDAWDYGEAVFDGYILIGYTEGVGFTELGRVSHYDAAAPGDSLWAYQSVRRGAYIGGVLYTLSQHVIVSTDLTSFRTVDRLEFYPPEQTAAVEPEVSTASYAVSSVSKVY